MPHTLHHEAGGSPQEPVGEAAAVGGGRGQAVLSHAGPGGAEGGSEVCGGGGRRWQGVTAAIKTPGAAERRSWVARSHQRWEKAVWGRQQDSSDGHGDGAGGAARLGASAPGTHPTHAGEPRRWDGGERALPSPPQPPGAPQPLCPLRLGGLLRERPPPSRCPGWGTGLGGRRWGCEVPPKLG